MTAFALLIAALLSFVSYELILYYQRKTTIQAAEFNLRLVSRIIEQDLLNLSSLARTWSTNSTTNALIADYFESEGANAKGAVDAYHSMQDDFRVNRSNNYVRRMIVTDFGEKFLQLDNAVSGSTPLTIHNIGRLNGLAGGEPGSAPEFMAACHVYSPTLEMFQEALAPHRAEIRADVANYTDIVPIVQFSEIVEG